MENPAVNAAAGACGFAVAVADHEGGMGSRGAAGISPSLVVAAVGTAVHDKPLFGDTHLE